MGFGKGLCNLVFEVVICILKYWFKLNWLNLFFIFFFVLDVISFNWIFFICNVCNVFFICGKIWVLFVNKSMFLFYFDKRVFFFFLVFINFLIVFFLGIFKI